MKTERRMKKLDEEAVGGWRARGGAALCWRRGAGAGACSCPVLTGRCPQLLKKMSSSDTPLGTVALLQEKQKAQKTPYIVLSGSGKSMNAYVRVRWRAAGATWGGRPPLSAASRLPSLCRNTITK